MAARPKRHTLDRLRARIAHMEGRPGTLEPMALQAQSLRQNDLPLAQPGSLHEIFADSARDGAAGLGFTLLQARQLVTPQRPALFFFQLAHEGQETGLPYALGLKAYGLDANRLILGRMKKLEDLLWALEEALACRAVAGVIAEVRGQFKTLDFTVSRRLGLRAHEGGAGVFMLRYGHEREASAADFRWRVAPSLSGERLFDARAPGAARWHVELEKARHWGNGANGYWLVSGTQDGIRIVEAAGGGEKTDAPTSGAASAALCDRLSETG